MSIHFFIEPPVFIKPMEHKDITEGETTVLECMAGGHPKPKLTWTKESQPLVATSRHFFTAENQLLIIVNSAKTDSGNYNCEIANSVGTERGSSRLTIIPRKSSPTIWMILMTFFV
jgi:leucine-rich repeats and immunoglobulin-like domains protein 1/3